MVHAKPIADMLDLCLGPSLAARGFAESSIVAVWPEIVGSRLALYSRPLKIEWKGRRKKNSYDDKQEPAHLVVLIESAFAVEMQHMAPTIIERINRHYGWRCVQKLVLKQGTVARVQPAHRKVQPLTSEQKEQLQETVKDIPDERLRRALEHLGEAVLSSRK